MILHGRVGRVGRVVKLFDMHVIVFVSSRASKGVALSWG